MQEINKRKNGGIIMGSNLISNFINGGISITSSAVSSVVSGLVTTFFVRKNTASEEFEKIKAGKFSEAIDILLDSGKMSYLEYYKCNNFLKIAQLADHYLQKEKYFYEDYKTNKYDFDWFVKFYDYSSNISNDEMRKLWASILKSEIKSPGTTSISLLHALSMMNFDQAMLFCNICRFTLTDIKTNDPHLLLFVSTNREAYKNSGITPSGLKELERLGLIECDFSTEYVFLKKKVLRKSNKIVTIYGDPANNEKIKAGNAIFTRDGHSLYSIIDDDYKKFNSDIFNNTIVRFVRRNCRVEINGTTVL